MFQPYRPRRLRKSPGVRALVEETRINVSDLIAPLFFIEGKSQAAAINSMPGQFRYSLDKL
ncbi:MAG: porphobilinogen synthase, partial [Bacteriovoracaceae bacterium]